MKKILSMILLAAMCLSLLTVMANADNIITVRNYPDGESEEASTPLDAASDFTFDAMTMEYSFTGAANAQFYFIKVYPVVDGAESVSASFQSAMIPADSSNSYAGVIEGETLLAGDYVAYVVASASGYKSSEASATCSSTLLAEASLKANWKGGDEQAPEVSVEITVTAGDAYSKSFTVVITNEAGEEVYRNDDAQAGVIALTAEDLGVESLSKDDIYNVTLSINPVKGYTLPANNLISEQISEASSSGS